MIFKTKTKAAFFLVVFLVFLVAFSFEIIYFHYRINDLKSKELIKTKEIQEGGVKALNIMRQLFSLSEFQSSSKFYEYDNSRGYKSIKYESQGLNSNTMQKSDILLNELNIELSKESCRLNGSSSSINEYRIYFENAQNVLIDRIVHSRFIGDKNEELKYIEILLKLPSFLTDTKSIDWQLVRASSIGVISTFLLDLGDYKFLRDVVGVNRIKRSLSVKMDFKLYFKFEYQSISDLEENFLNGKPSLAMKLKFYKDAYVALKQLDQLNQGRSTSAIKDNYFVSYFYSYAFAGDYDAMMYRHKESLSKARILCTVLETF